MINSNYLLLFIIAILSTSCAKIPYYPEPFGTLNYSYNKKSKKLELKGNGYKTLAQSVVTNRSNPIVNISTIAQYQQIQDHYINQFAMMSTSHPFLQENDNAHDEEILVINAPSNQDTENALPSEANFNTTWKEVASNGLNYVDAVCHDYLRQINRLKKNTKGLKRLSVNSGYAAAEVLALTLGSTANPSRVLGILASAFGLGANVFDIYEDTILFHAEFSGIYTMLDVLKDKQRLAAQSVTTRSQAVRAIQDYLFICTPHAIEAAINAKIGGKIPDELVNSLGVSEFTSRVAKNQTKLLQRLKGLIDKITTNYKAG